MKIIFSGSTHILCIILSNFAYCTNVLVAEKIIIDTEDNPEGRDVCLEINDFMKELCIW